MPSPMPLRIMLALLGLGAATPAAAEPPPLWSTDRPVPATAELSGLPGIEFHVIKRHEPRRDGYDWLHGVALVWHRDKLYATFGHNPGTENTETEEARGVMSSDGGRTWSEVFTIDPGSDSNLGVSHGVLLSTGRQLWAFQGAFTGFREQLRTQAYLLDESTGTWQPKGVVLEGGFWPTQEPLRLADGNWIMAGFCVGNGNPAAVAISQGDDLLRWKLVVLPRPADQKMWGESTLLRHHDELINIARQASGGRALMAISLDQGRTWTPSLPSNLPMSATKPYSGTLSTGQHYLIGTTTADSGNRRSPLTIAVSRPGGRELARIFRIRDAQYSGPGESHPEARLSYPYAVERNGRLYVGFSNCGGRGRNRNSAELAVIPIDALRVD